MNARLLCIKDWEALARRADFQPARMAGLCLVSLRQLERFFAGHFHKTPQRWILELKCRLAQELIAQGYTTKAAAAKLEFADESHFCHRFKKCCGVSPRTSALMLQQVAFTQ